MVFDYNLDRSLWAIMSIKENCDEISCFINNLPIEIYKDVRLGLSERFNDNFKICNKEIENDNGYNYSYQIDICNDCLMLKVYKYNTHNNKNDETLCVREEEYFCLTLNMLHIPLTRSISHEYLGSFISSRSKTIEKNGVCIGIQYVSSYGNYDLVPSVLGNIVRCKSENGTFYKRVNFNKNMPKEIYLSDFSNKSNNLVRTNKRGRK